MDKKHLNLQERSHPALMWFRRDLRIDDQPALLAASKQSKGRVIPVYCLDPRTFGTNEIGWPKLGAYRARFLIEALTDLKSKLKRVGSDLIIRQGLPEEILPDLATKYGATHLFSHEAQSYEEDQTIEAVQDQCIRNAIEYCEIEGITLYHLDRTPFDLNTFPTNFIRFRRALERDSHPHPPELSIDKLLPLPLGLNSDPMPTLERLGLSSFTPDPRTIISFTGGEVHGLRRLKDYVWERRLLSFYHLARENLGGEQISTKLSPWINLGCISPRRIWYEGLAFEQKHGSSLGVYQLIYGLTLRDFFIFHARRYKQSFFKLEGIRNQKDAVKQWPENHELFGLFWQGYSGFPLVDACMRELGSTGYLSPQGRKVVGEFCTQHLKLPWTWVACCFETLLIDYCPATTYGWLQSFAGVGLQMNVRSRHHAELGSSLDQDAAYIRYWLPELANLPSEVIYEPYLMDEETQAYYGVILNQTYPFPLIPPPLRPQRDALDIRKGLQEKRHLQIQSNEETSS
jgi:deoxyribodipyrimidine photo-lyase